MVASRRWASRSRRWDAYVPVTTRRQRAEREAARASKRGTPLQPVAIEGRQIASTPWGKTWCAHIEGFHDYSNRLPRGRTYARNGSVIDLTIDVGVIRAQVMGSELYEQVVTIRPCRPKTWKRVVARCQGGVGSLIELLSGRISASIMKEMTGVADGLLPDLSQVEMCCSCPDWATLCKHLAAVLYGVGARLDAQPELLFTLRDVDPGELLSAGARAGTPTNAGRRLEGDLSEVFGIELDDSPTPPAGAAPKPSRAKNRSGYQVLHRLKRNGEIESRDNAPELLSRQVLIAQGVPAGTLSAWVRQGILQATETRGVYRHTPASKKRLQRYDV